MTKYCKFILFFLILLSPRLFAQEKQHADKKKSYWQQEVNYTIHVELDDESHTLSGYINMNYINNSPEKLDYIYMHLWPNAYKDESSALCEQMLLYGESSLYYADSTKLGYISELDFSSGGKKLKWAYDKEHQDIAKIYFPKGIMPGDQIEITTPFFVKIPSGEFSRLGHSEQSYQITQWYPKPAVYDVQGWHPMPYLNVGEFYSEFGSYDVHITLPENYRVGATGDLVNGEKEKAWMDSLARKTRKIVRYSDDLSFPKSSTKKKTLHFHQDKVHDFAWFADKRYHVLQGEVTLENGHTVKTQALFTNEEAVLWTKSIDYLNRSVQYYSSRLGNYPYKQASAVQGTLSAGAGMEYPNITIIGTAGNKFMLEEVIMHEVGHNWLYGILGFNERDYPWLDEGINSFYETQYMQEFHKELGFLEAFFDNENGNMEINQLDPTYHLYLAYKFLASYRLDQAANLKSPKYTEINYATIVYGKAALCFRYLQDYLGKDAFDMIMQDFYEQWKFKHPQPTDLIDFFEQRSGKDLSWFFQELIGSTDHADYKISSVNEAGDSIYIEVKNVGKIASPVLISTESLYGQKQDHQWMDGFEGKKKIGIAKGDYEKIELNNKFYMLDNQPGNNFFKPNKLIPKWRTSKLKFLASIPKAEESHLYFAPVAGWNYYNKFMLGALFTNHTAFEKKWEYELMPMYSFRTYNWNGSFGFRRNFYPKSLFRRISLGIGGKKYNYDNQQYKNAYQRLVPELSFYFRNPAGNTRINHIIRLRSVYVEKEELAYYLSGETFIPYQNTNYHNVVDLNYQYLDNRKINPYGILFYAQFNEEIVKMDFKFRYKFSYQKPKKGLEMTLFVGKIFYHEKRPDIDYSYKMSGWNGSNDYLFDYTYLGRSEQDGVWANQMVDRDGGFYLPSPLGRTWDINGALNLKTSLPFTGFIKLYGNFGISSNQLNSQQLLYEAGAIISIVDKYFEIYFPALWSNEYQQVIDLTPDHNYWNNVRFTMRLDLLDPFKTLKELNL